MIKRSEQAYRYARATATKTVEQLLKEVKRNGNTTIHL